MSQLMLKRLVGLALLDQEFCDGLMNGKRRALLAGFELTEEEREVILCLESSSIRDLAGSLCELLNEPKALPVLEMPYSSVGARQGMRG
ncbi:MAG: hypothetical protein PVH41_02835 [Anaerolineae bacterium]|jgi:hypothetical protein